MHIKKTFLTIILIGLWMSTTGQLCTKELAHGKNYTTAPVKQYYVSDLASVTKNVQRILQENGFEVLSVDESRGRITTGWRPTGVDSHYCNFFGRRDYGASDGAYYQLTADMSDENSKIKVNLSTTVKSLVGKMESSGVVERKIFTKLDDYLRSPQIEMTNVGVRNK
jgi:hypothetical protein